MRRKRGLAVSLLAIGVPLVLGLSIVGAATPKEGTFAGETADTSQKISIKVKSETKGVINYCKYNFKAKITNKGFSGAYKGPGGTYLAVKGTFPSKRKATGKITTDFLCDAEGEKFTANLK